MFNRNTNHDHTLTLLIATLIWLAGGYLLIKNYLETHILNGPMALILIIGVVMTVFAAIQQWRQK